MTTYQDVVAANLAALAFAFTEAAGNFAPYIGAGNLVVTPTVDYRQGGPTGASSYGVNVRVGAKLTYTYAQVFFPPATTEVWVKLSTVTPAANLRLWSTGDDTANGVEFYVTPTSHLHLTGPGRYDVDTGITWPDTNWHLLQFASSQGNTLQTIGFDGVVRYQSSPGTPNAPSPNTLTLGGSSGVVETTATLFAWPAVYLYAMNPAQMASSFIAATNPTAALSGTLSGGGVAPGAVSDQLATLLKYVSATYQNTP